MTNLMQQMRNWLGRDGDDSRPDGDGRPVPIPAVRPPFTKAVSARPQRPATEAARTDEQAEQEASPEQMKVAQGQELLGPCRECDGYWTREVARGQKPLTCPVCKREGPPGH